jgi:hypothetical protein
MAIQVNGCTVIDDDRNIVNAGDIRVGLVTITGSNGNIQTSGTITGAGYSVSGVGFTAFPGAGTTVTPVETASIILSFPTSVTRGTGTVTLRTGSAGGTIVKSYDAATAPEITVLNNTWAVSVASTTYTSFGASPILPAGQQIFLVIPSTAIAGFVGLNTTGADSYSFNTRAVANLGQAVEGGFLICKAGGTQWIVAPSASQVSRSWYNRCDANIRAQQVSGFSGWFVPTCLQLQNPGFICRVYWDAYCCAANYWSNSDSSAGCATPVYFNQGNFAGSQGYKSIVHCVRSFRCVSY